MTKTQVPSCAIGLLSGGNAIRFLLWPTRSCSANTPFPSISISGIGVLSSVNAGDTSSSRPEESQFDHLMTDTPPAEPSYDNY